MEKNCKWHFDKSGISVTGPNDSIHETFRANPYYSLVREAVQNSIDAIDNENAPVKVVFEFGSLEKKKYPNLFEIKKHIIACWQYHKGDTQAERHFHPMSSYIDKNDMIQFLKVSDYNTKGMVFESKDVNCPFISFVRAEGKSAKQSGAGGSFGFGKGAYYVLSHIKTVLVSTKTKSGNSFFEGKTRLATHELNGELLTRDGYYNQDYTTPVFNSSDIPNKFVRSETGTDIYILGLIEERDRKKEMVKSILNNFWLAVYDKKLEVKIVEGDEVIIINRDTLESTIENYFPSIYESGSPTDISGWNPKAYYKAVKNANLNDNYILILGFLPTLGEVKLYVYMEKGLPNRVAYLRKPRMVVQKKTKNKLNGFVAVLLCDNVDGNELLRQMENAAHNEWKPQNYRDGDDESIKLVYRSYDELKTFVNDKLESLSKVDTSKKINFIGLEEYLSIPEDLLEKDDEYESKGDNPNNVSGTASKDLSVDETGMQTTNNNEPVKITAKIKEQSQVLDEQDFDVSDDGEEIITVGGDNEGVSGDERGTNDGNTGAMGTQTVKSKDSRVLVNVKLKVAAQKEQNDFYHNLIISSENEIDNAELELLVAGDNDKEDGLEIVFTSIGEVQNNKLSKVPLSIGRNQIKIRFADNLKHSIKIKAYEVQ